MKVKHPTIWTDEKQKRMSKEKRRNKKIKEEKIRESQKKENASAGKGRKVAKSPNMLFSH